MLGEFNGVFAFPAAQFENDRIIVSEKIAAPLLFHVPLKSQYLVGES